MPAKPPISLQLYTLRDSIIAEPESVIRRLAEIGYVGVEPYPTIPYAQAAPLLEEYGLKAHSIHSPIPLGDTERASLEMAEAYGADTIVFGYSPDEFKSVENIKRNCDNLNRAWEVANRNGFRLAYHNHWWEYETVEGQFPFKIMLENLNPAVLFEVDVYWVKVGGHDPATIVKEMGARAPLLHIKDGPADEPPSDMVAVGQGVLNMPEIVAAGEPHTEWLIVELDRCGTDMMQAVAESHDYLVSEGLARGKSA